MRLDGTSYVTTTAIVHVVAPLVMRFKGGPLTDVDHEARGTRADTESISHAAGAKIQRLEVRSQLAAATTASSHAVGSAPCLAVVAW